MVSVARLIHAYNPMFFTYLAHDLAPIASKLPSLVADVVLDEYLPLVMVGAFGVLTIRDFIRYYSADVKEYKQLFPAYSDDKNNLHVALQRSYRFAISTAYNIYAVSKATVVSGVALATVATLLRYGKQ